MVKAVKVLGVAIVLLPVVLIGGCFGRLWYQGRQFEHLEQNARKVINASELQAWALRILAAYPSYSGTQFYQLRTNYPQQLRNLAPGLGPMVSISEVNSTNSPEDWTNMPSFISLVWGSGFMGHS